MYGGCGPGNYGAYPDAFNYFCMRDSNWTWDWNDEDSQGNGTEKVAPDRTSIMNRLCYAEPKEGKQFVCYDIAPGTNMTAHFEDHEAMIDFYDCEGELEFSFGDTSMVYYSNNTYMLVDDSLDNAPWNSTTPLTPELMGALSIRTSFAYLQTSYPTISPTTTPTVIPTDAGESFLIPMMWWMSFGISSVLAIIITYVIP